MTIAKAMPGASGVVVTSDNVHYQGFAVCETGGAVAQFRVRSGSVTGLILDTIKLLAGESASAWYGPQGIFADGGLYFEKVAGTIEGSLRYA